MKKYLHYLLATITQLLMCSYTLGTTLVASPVTIDQASTQTTAIVYNESSTSSSKIKSRSRIRRKCTTGCVLIRSAKSDKPSKSVNETIQLTGVIKDQDHELVPFASVAVLKNSEIYSGTISSEEGKFILGDIEFDTMDLQISCIGFATQIIREIPINHQGTDNMVIELKKGYEISEFVCEAKRPHCFKACGAGCICKCCFPDPLGSSSDEGRSLDFTQIDTISYSSFYGWPASGQIQTLPQITSDAATEILERGVPPEQVTHQYQD